MNEAKNTSEREEIKRIDNSKFTVLFFYRRIPESK